MYAPRLVPPKREMLWWGTFSAANLDCHCPTHNTNIMYAVHHLSQHSIAPGPKHLIAMK